MRRLILLRHAKSDWPTGVQRDLDRPLADRGRQVAPMVARYLAEQGILPEMTLVSPARRTRETWELMEPELRGLAEPGRPRFAYEPRIYEAEWQDLLAVVKATEPAVQTLMLVGHNPGLQDLATRLASRGGAGERQRLAEKFPTAALAVIEFSADDWQRTETGTGRLDRFVTPRTLASIAAPGAG